MKKLCTLILLLIVSVFFVACKKETKLTYLTQQDIFAQEGTYFVVFMRKDCPDCENVKPLLITYIDLLAKEDVKFADKSFVYAVNLSDSTMEKIYRTYSNSRQGWGEGQGDNKNFWVNGIETWDQLYIAETSAMISIGTTKDGAVKATFEAAGYDAIYARLTGHLGIEE